jgi:hypothetical protein
MRREGSRRAALALTARRPAERDDREPTALGGQSSHAMDLGRKRWPALRHLSLQLARRPTEREEGALGVDKLASDRGEKGMAGRRRDGHQGGLFQGRERSGPASATRDCRPRGPWRGAMGTLRRARRAEGSAARGADRTRGKPFTRDQRCVPASQHLSRLRAIEKAHKVRYWRSPARRQCRVEVTRNSTSQ